MKKPWLSILISIMLLSACNQYPIPDKNPASTLTPTLQPVEPTVSIIITSSATLTALPVISSTPSPTITKLSPTPNLTPTITKPTPTLNLSPTLSTGKRQDYIFNFLTNNSSCKLPCWMGIVPGMTEWSEAKGFFEFLGARTSYAHTLSDNSIFHGIGGLDIEDHQMFNDMDLWEQEGMIQALLIHSVSYRDLAYYYQFWKKYSPENILKSYGSPTRVTFFVFRYLNSRTYSARLFIYYDRLKLLAIYESSTITSTEKGKEVLRICPTWKDALWKPEIQMYMLSGNNPMSVEDFFVKISDPNQLTGTPIKEGAGISVEEFYRLFTSDEAACFDTPIELWN